VTHTQQNMHTQFQHWQTAGSSNHIPVARSDLEDTSLLGHEFRFLSRPVSVVTMQGQTCLT